MIGDLLLQLTWLITNAQYGNVYMLLEQLKKYKNDKKISQKVSSTIYTSESFEAVRIVGNWKAIITTYYYVK